MSSPFGDVDSPLERARRALTTRAGELILDDGTVIAPLTGDVGMLVAQLVHQLDMEAWRRGSGLAADRPDWTGLCRRAGLSGASMSMPRQTLMYMQHPNLDRLRDQLHRQNMVHDVAAARPELIPDMESHLKIEPRETVRVRNEVAAWLEDRGSAYYGRAVADGRQQFFVDIPGMSEGEALAVAEADTLRRADLYYIDSEMCQLLLSAWPKMPAFAPMKSDLPSERGFAIFAAPLSHHYNRPYRGGGRPSGVENRFDLEDDHIGVQVIAVSWRPHYTPHVGIAPAKWKAGGVWFSFYAIPAVHQHAKQLDRPDAAELRQIAKATPPLTPDNEVLMAWFDPELCGEQDGYMLSDTIGNAGKAKAVFAAFQLARQKNLAGQSLIKVAPRPVPKSKARRGFKPDPGGEVILVKLRDSVMKQRDAAAPDGEQAKREYRCRWEVEGFWRQTWFAKSGVHRPQWIAPYLKGPDGAPFRPKQNKVILVTPPKQEAR